MKWFAQVAIFSRLVVPRDDGAASAAFGPVIVVPVVGQKVFQRSQEEGTEAPVLRTDRRQTVSFQKTGQELLGQILGLMMSASLATNKGVERIPIGAAKCCERLFLP